jgi:hypothetical protein
MWPIQRAELKSAFFTPLTLVRLMVPISSGLPTSAGGRRATTLKRPIGAETRDNANVSAIPVRRDASGPALVEGGQAIVRDTLEMALLIKRRIGH